MTTNELAILYHLLAQCFSYPSNYLIESLKRLVGELRIESWDSGSQGQPILPIASFVRALAALDRRVIGDLQQEHARLFGMARRPCVRLTLERTILMFGAEF